MPTAAAEATTPPMRCSVQSKAMLIDWAPGMRGSQFTAIHIITQKVIRKTKAMARVVRMAPVYRLASWVKEVEYPRDRVAPPAGAWARACCAAARDLVSTPGPWAQRRG